MASEDIATITDTKTFKWGKDINLALNQLADARRKPQVVLVLEALAHTYPELREIIYQTRGWSDLDSSQAE